MKSFRLKTSSVVESHSVRVLQRKRTNNIHVCWSVYLSLYLQRHLFSGIGSYDYGSWQVQNLQDGLVGEGHREEPVLQGNHCLPQNSFFLRGQSCFCLGLHGSDEAHIEEGNLLYSESVDLNVTLIQEHPHRNTQNNV